MNKYLFLIILILISFSIMAQPGPPGAPGCWPPPCVPVDGGITIFGLIAAIFGYNIISKNNKTS